MGLYTQWLSQPDRLDILFQYKCDNIKSYLIPLLNDGTIAHYWYNDNCFGLDINLSLKEVQITYIEGTANMDSNGKSKWLDMLVSMFSNEWKFRYEQKKYINESNVEIIQRVYQNHSNIKKGKWNTILID